MPNVIEFKAKTRKRTEGSYGRFCTNCNSTSFEIVEASDSDTLLVVCAGCGKEMVDLEARFRDDN